MTTNIQISLEKLKLPLVGVKGLAVLVDGVEKAELQFGGTATIEVGPGERKIEVELRGVVTRRSKPLLVAVAEGNTASIEAKYSRLWGDVRLSAA